VDNPRFWRFEIKAHFKLCLIFELSQQFHDKIVDVLKTISQYIPTTAECIWGDYGMVKTITLGSCVSVQGTFIRKLANGKIVVRVGDRVFSGFPVAAAA